jgi:hypothetical protein
VLSITKRYFTSLRNPAMGLVDVARGDHPDVGVSP